MGAFQERIHCTGTLVDEERGGPRNAPSRAMSSSPGRTSHSQTTIAAQPISASADWTAASRAQLLWNFNRQ